MANNNLKKAKFALEDSQSVVSKCRFDFTYEVTRGRVKNQQDSIITDHGLKPVDFNVLLK